MGIYLLVLLSVYVKFNKGYLIPYRASIFFFGRCITEPGSVDYDRQDILSADEWEFVEAIREAEEEIYQNLAFTQSEQEENAKTLDNTGISDTSNDTETLQCKSLIYKRLLNIKDFDIDILHIFISIQEKIDKEEI
ncbi:MAG: hypothetical protein ACI4QR_05100, partial [Eubacteriales bacterium]